MTDSELQTLLDDARLMNTRLAECIVGYVDEILKLRKREQEAIAILADIVERTAEWPSLEISRALIVLGSTPSFVPTGPFPLKTEV